MMASCIYSGIKLKITTKKLGSGKLQVKFFTNFHKKNEVYGYLLVESKTTLKDVVTGIYDKLIEIEEEVDYRHKHLYSVGRTKKDNFQFMIFDG